VIIHLTDSSPSKLKEPVILYDKDIIEWLHAERRKYFKRNKWNRQ
jgi:hypothetical protein